MRGKYVLNAKNCSFQGWFHDFFHFQFQCGNSNAFYRRKNLSKKNNFQKIAFLRQIIYGFANFLLWILTFRSINLNIRLRQSFELQKYRNLRSSVFKNHQRVKWNCNANIFFLSYRKRYKCTSLNRIFWNWIFPTYLIT